MERLIDAPGAQSIRSPTPFSPITMPRPSPRMRVCLAHGLRVPQDIAFVGFDDIPAAAQATPPLSTVTVDKEALGRRGVELLLEDTPRTRSPTCPPRSLPVHMSSLARARP